MTKGNTHEADGDLQEEQRSPMENCRVHRPRRNAMWNIFEGVESALVWQTLAGSSADSGQQEEASVVVVVDSACDTTVSECLPHLSHPHSQSSASSSSSSSPSSISSSSEQYLEPPRGIQRSYSATAGEETRAALQNRQRRNAVGNLFDLLTPSQQLLLVEHLQEQVGRLQGGFHGEDSDRSQVILSLADLSSKTSSSSGSSSGSSPRSQGEIVCR